MHKKSLIGLLAAVLAAATIVLAAPAGAIANACTISMWPNLPGGQSSLKQNCTETTATGTVGGHGLISAGQETSLEDFPQAVWHFGAARTALNGAANLAGVAATAIAPAYTCLTMAASGHVTAADVNHGISYPALPANLPAGMFISAVGTAPCGAGKVTIVDGAANADLLAGKIAANAALLIENSDGRLTEDGTITSGSAVVCSLAANFRTADQGRVLSGTGIPYNDHIMTTQGAIAPCTAGQTSATLAVAVPVATPTANNQQLSISADARPITNLVGTTTTREISDVTQPNVNTLCSKMANFGASDIQLPVLSVTGGAPVGGAPLPGGNWITAVFVAATAPCGAGQTKATISGAGITVIAANDHLVIGQPNAAAPKNGDVMSQLGAEIVLSPTLVTGQPACTAHQPQGFDELGSWTNPGSIVQGTLAGSFDDPNDPYLNQPIIASVDFPTSVVTFSGYVEQVKAGGNLLVPPESDAAAHYDVKFPALPAGFAACPTASDTSGLAASFNYFGTSQSIAKAAAGTGTPGTGIVRALNNSSVAVAGTSFVHVANNTFTASTACTTPGPPVAADISVTAGAINHQCALAP